MQRDPTNAARWYELGVKQQENEREQKAIQALRRALELDPTHLASWLALAISHTNEGNRSGAYSAIREWVERNERYSAAVAQFRALNPEPEDARSSERLQNMMHCLMSIVREHAGGEIDADIQIALAVLLNTNEVRGPRSHLASVCICCLAEADCYGTLLGLCEGPGLLYHSACRASRCEYHLNGVPILRLTGCLSPEIGLVALQSRRCHAGQQRAS